MSLIEEARQKQKPFGPKCGVGILLDLHPEIADELAEALADKTLHGSKIADALADRYGEHAPTAGILNRHRNGECACDS